MTGWLRPGFAASFIFHTFRKAGDIGDFVRTRGGGYDAMLVLDADNLMDGAE
jgi:membrane glycosyltransferase